MSGLMSGGARCAWVLALLLALPGLSALAQTSRAADSAAPGPGTAAHSLSLQVDNDEFAGINRRDRWYSQAMRLHYFAPDTGAGWSGELARLWCGLQPCAPSLQAARRWSLGQDIHTQNRRDLPTPDPQDRPTAGWLYLSGAVLLESADETRMAELQLGVVGPAAGAQALQRVWHQMLGVSDVRGWSSQIRPRAGLQLQLVHERRIPLLGSQLDAVLRSFASLGSVSAQAGGGIVLRVGDRLSGTASAAQAQAATGRIGSGGRWSVQAGLGVRAVAYDYLLDGPVYGYASQVRHAPWVGEASLGATWAPAWAPMAGWQWRFALLRRTIDFESVAVTQGRFSPQTFGVIQASVDWR